MKIQPTQLSFKGININRLKSLDRISLPDLNSFEKMAENVDVFLKSTRKSFPYKGSTLTPNTVEILARPKNLSFFEKLFGKKTQKAYYPVGILRDLIDEPKPSFEELFKTVVSKVK